MAPECLKKNYVPCLASDVWSLGVCLYLMLVGTPPFWHKQESVVLKNIVSKDITFPKDLISLEAEFLIRGCLTKDVNSRFTLDDILNHQFLNCGYNIPKCMPLSTLKCPPSKGWILNVKNEGMYLNILTQTEDEDT